MQEKTLRRLVELMIVIGVITILAAMTFPTVGFVRTRAQQNACLSNMRQWGIAFSGYLDDHRGKFPSPFGSDDKEVWYNVLSPYVGTPSMKELVDSGTAPVAGKSGRSVFLCPVDRATDLFEEEHGGGTSPYSSYAMNANIDSAANSAPYSKRLRLSQLRHPSTFVLMAETGHGCENGITRATLGTEAGDDSFRHGHAINLCFADGSASRHAQEDVLPGTADNTPAGTLIWSTEVDSRN